MWTFDAFPSAKVAASYGFAPDAKFLDHVRKSSLRIAGGCSASFVSAQGLVMTNHHCALGCVEQNSTAEHNFVEDGFYAKGPSDELKCPNFELDRLDAIDDVTPAVRSATAGKTGGAFLAAQHAIEAKLSSSCGDTHGIRCDVVTLYHGGVYKLYHYTKFDDVRLAFAPEYGVAQFGGDPDNFNFPRFDFDVSFVRAYVDGKPAATPEFLRWSANGAKAGDLTFVSGNPGTTYRQLTVSQLAYLRDVQNPRALLSAAERRGIYEQYGTEGADQHRQTKETLFGIQNSYKGNLGRELTLLDPAFFSKKLSQENALRAAIAKNPALARTVGNAFDALAAVQQRKHQLAYRNQYIANGSTASLFRDARSLVRYPVESAKPTASGFPNSTAHRFRRSRDGSHKRRPTIRARKRSISPFGRKKCAKTWVRTMRSCTKFSAVNRLSSGRTIS